MTESPATPARGTPQRYEGPRGLGPGECWMCGPSEDELFRADGWRVVLNWNQDRLGKVMIAPLRHEEDVTRLGDDEVLSLWALVRRTTAVLRALFDPDQFNYSFLMNLDPHAHLHVIPRYRTPREFLGMTFVDEEAGEHRLSRDGHRGLAEALRAAFNDRI